MNHQCFWALAMSSILDHDMDILYPFAMKLRNNLTTASFDEMLHTFSKAGMVTLTKMQSHVWYLFCFAPIQFACCINSCVCFTGLHTNLDRCLKCKTSHLDKSGQARQTFSYMPLIPCLCALMSNRTYAAHLQYCADKHAKTHIPGITMDIFDGQHYCLLLGEHVVVGDQYLAHHYFSDHCDIVLGFATNGFTPFKKWKHTMWILLVFNYNLPPDQCFQQDNILCVGIIPGPKKPCNADLFIYPLLQELLKLASGVSIYSHSKNCPNVLPFWKEWLGINQINYEILWK